MKLPKYHVITTILIGTIGSANAALLALYGNGVQNDEAAFNSTVTPSGYTASSLTQQGLIASGTTITITTLGSGATPAGPTAGSSASSQSFNLPGNVVTTLTVGAPVPVSTDEYFQFSVAGTGGNLIDPTSFRFDLAVVINNATGSMTETARLFYSTDGETFTAIGTDSVAFTPGSVSNVTQVSPVISANVDLTSLAAAPSYTFRLAFGDGSGIVQKSGLVQGISLNGDVVPEPSSLVLLTLGALGFLRRRR